MVDDKDDKDRLGDKLKQKQKGDEDRFFAERDKALLEKLRGQGSAPAAAHVAAGPRDGSRLTTTHHRGVAVDRCPTCRGLWLDAGELEKIVARERNSWLGELLR